MSDDRQSGGDPSQGGVFGNLPESRPGIRSPRRHAGQAASPRPRPTETNTPARPGPTAEKAESASARPAPSREQAPTGGEEPGGVNGIEDLAWAGVAAAAEAATIGVRLASRAFEALRGTTERR